MCEGDNVEFNGLEVHDLLGLSQPLTKLVETVSSGIGTLYTPIHIRRMAKAKDFELQLISSTVNNNLQLPTKYEDGKIIVDSTDANQLVQRAENRFLFQEMKKQQNIESVINKAAETLSTVQSASDIPVDDDWISEFFNCVANISNETMQILWGKVLAGEVEKPGHFSKRTLDTLRKLTQKDAEMFSDYAKFVLSCPLEFDYDPKTNDCFIPAMRKLTQKYDIRFSTIMFLVDAGLMSYDNAVCAGPILPPGGEGYLYYHERPVIKFTSAKTERVELCDYAYLLTSAGKELLTIIESTQSLQDMETYFEDCKNLYCSEESLDFENSLEIKERPIEGVQGKVICQQ